MGFQAQDVLKSLNQQLASAMLADLRFSGRDLLGRAIQPEYERLVRDAARLSGGTEDRVSSDLFLQGVPRYLCGTTLQELVEEGVVSESLIDPVLMQTEAQRPLYRHQELVLRLLEDERRDGREQLDLLIATGTGSGKTETFLYPILDTILREPQEEQRRGGVRALFLYPTKALADDQLKRFRCIAGQSRADWRDDAPHPVTFGRIAGNDYGDPGRLEIDEETTGAWPLPAQGERYASFTEGESLSRRDGESRAQQIRRTPVNEVFYRYQVLDPASTPKLLLTNYVMLDRLLQRPAAAPLFSSGSWDWIVLDETHVYDGVTAAEMAGLLSRLLERIETAGRRPRIVLASATLPSGERGQRSRELLAELCGRRGHELVLVEGERDADISSIPDDLLGESSSLDFGDFQDFDLETLESMFDVVPETGGPVSAFLESEPGAEWMARLTNDQQATIKEVARALSERPQLDSAQNLATATLSRSTLFRRLADVLRQGTPGPDGTNRPWTRRAPELAAVIDSEDEEEREAHLGRLLAVIHRASWYRAGARGLVRRPDEVGPPLLFLRYHAWVRGLDDLWLAIGPPREDRSFPIRLATAPHAPVSFPGHDAERRFFPISLCRSESCRVGYLRAFRAHVPAWGLDIALTKNPAVDDELVVLDAQGLPIEFRRSAAPLAHLRVIDRDEDAREEREDDDSRRLLCPSCGLLELPESRTLACGHDASHSIPVEVRRLARRNADDQEETEPEETLAIEDLTGSLVCPVCSGSVRPTRREIGAQVGLLTESLLDQVYVRPERPRLLAFSDGRQRSARDAVRLNTEFQIAQRRRAIHGLLQDHEPARVQDIGPVDGRYYDNGFGLGCVVGTTLPSDRQIDRRLEPVLQSAVLPDFVPAPEVERGVGEMVGALSEAAAIVEFWWNLPQSLSALRLAASWIALPEACLGQLIDVAMDIFAGDRERANSWAARLVQRLVLTLQDQRSVYLFGDGRRSGTIDGHRDLAHLVRDELRFGVGQDVVKRRPAGAPSWVLGFIPARRGVRLLAGRRDHVLRTALEGAALWDEIAPADRDDQIEAVLEMVFEGLVDPANEVLISRDPVPCGDGWRRVAEQMRFGIAPGYLRFGRVGSWLTCPECGDNTPEFLALWDATATPRCARFRCDGRLDPAPTAVNPALERFIELVTADPRDKQPIGAWEHTAQVPDDQRSRLELAFKADSVGASYLLPRENDTAISSAHRLPRPVTVVFSSTTFEVGVDVAGLRAVLLRNVPPGPANYVQRAGRAGRSRETNALVVTMAGRNPHDRYYVRHPEDLVSGQLRPLRLPIRNWRLVRRHLFTVLFSGWWRQLVEDFPDRFSGQERDLAAWQFFDPEPNSGVSLDDFLRWVDSVPDAGPLANALRGIARRLDCEEQVEGIAQELREAFHGQQMDREPSEPELDGTGMMPAALAWASQLERYAASGDEDFAQRQQAEVRDRRLPVALAEYGILPRYAFPLESVSLVRLATVERGRRIRRQYERDLRIAIREYEPGRRIIADGEELEIGGLVAARPHEAETEGDGFYVYCRNCEFFDLTHSRTTFEERYGALDQGVECERCQEQIESRFKRTYIRPRTFWFETERAAAAEAPPAGYSIVRQFVRGLEDRETAEVVAGLEARWARNTDVFVANQGKNARGHWFEPDAGILRVRRAGGEPGVFAADLGYILRTDVVQLSDRGATPLLALDGRTRRYRKSLVAALHEGAATALEVDPRDLGVEDVSLPDRRMAISFHDTEPGGSGTAIQLLQPSVLRRVVAEALDRVENCHCDERGACYDCLMRYDNQSVHDILSRTEAIDPLEALRHALLRPVEGRP